MRVIIYIITAMFFIVLFSFRSTEAKMTIEQAKKAVAGMRKACAKKSGANDELINNANNGEFPPDPKLQCYQKCILDKMKVTKDGMLEMNTMLQQADIMLNSDIVGRIKEVISTCAQQISSTEPCEAAWQFVKCYYEADSSLYFFP